MERDRDTPGRISWWEYAPKVVRIDQFCHDRRRAGTKSDEQVLTFTKARPHEKDLLTARDRSMVWADLLKGNPWGRSSNDGGCRLGNCLMRNRGRRCA